MDIWQESAAEGDIATFSIDFVRIAESQEQLATYQLVDNHEEQFVLENMLESSKPAGLYLRGLHYLFTAPFRYAPLKHGSRFGSRQEPSLLYGSTTVQTVLAEAAYYRCLFWSGMSVAPASGMFDTQHTVFGGRLSTENGLRLTGIDDEYQAALTSPADYRDTQKLGARMRDAGIEAFDFISARDPERGTNIALFIAGVIDTQEPTFRQPWLCATNDDGVSFFSAELIEIHEFSTETFLVDGVLPIPIH